MSLRLFEREDILRVFDILGLKRVYVIYWDRRMKSTFFQGKTSLFEDPASAQGPFSTMDISNLKQDLDGHKHWWSIGLRTYSGIALEAFNAPNGKIMFPLLALSKPIVRVPVILHPPWVESEEPQDTSENNMTCLKRGYFCYNKTGLTVRKLCCFGFSIDLLKILERELGFDAEIYFVADSQYGTFGEKAGKWNGIVNELVSGRGKEIYFYKIVVSLKAMVILRHG